MSRGNGTGYIPDKSHLMSSTREMLEFFKDGEKSFSHFFVFLKSNYNIETENWSYVKKKYKLNTTNFLFLCNC
uniref:Uncharacterized protein n=1 Tax=Siphoviridae sp. ctDXu9 TaxID=2825387 RepID=A0A8S5VD60_9CAUD|nr:MAG TPA: hypothetical protein [Siphoviridae sp. ctDXu9]